MPVFVVFCSCDELDSYSEVDDEVGDDDFISLAGDSGYASNSRLVVSDNFTSFNECIPLQNGLNWCQGHCNVLLFLLASN